jgi:hypothetical protein
VLKRQPVKNLGELGLRDREDVDSADVTVEGDGNVEGGI